jgi:glycosyltransferase involved in cell wall biosynthesis
MSRVDVIVPCYKYAHYLEGCVSNLLHEQDADVRVLIIDDCSPDNTPAVGAALAASDPRVEFRRHEKNRGHIATYNEGIDWAASEYFMVLSADDLLTPGALGRAVRLMDAHPDVGLTYGRAIMTSDPSLHTPRVPDNYKTRLLTGLEVLEAFCIEGGNRIPTQTAVVRTRLQKQVGGYRPDLPHSGDMEMWLRFALRGPVGVIDADQAYYRVHGGNMHIGYVSAVIGDMDQLRRTFEIVFRDNAELIPAADRDRLHDVARRAVAMRAVRKASVFMEVGDARGCRELLAFARSTFPRVSSEKTWRKLRLKRLVGARVCSTVRPLLNRLRGVPSARPTSMRIGLFPQM